MPVLRFDARELVRLVGRSIPIEKLVERLPMIGCDLEKVEGNEVTVEFFPNRPDVLSVEGLARAVRAFFDVKRGLAEYEVASGSEEVLIEPEVAKIRPFIGFARVSGISLTNERLKELVEFQERLTLGLGRRRKKVAIGIHDARAVRSPFRYRAVARDGIKFIPLGHARPMSPAEILAHHDKGQAYAALLEGHAKIPIIEDRAGQVLSMPPIINGTLTQLTTSTTDVLIDVTGTDETAVDGALSIVVTSLAERGGTIHSLVHRKGKDHWRAPDLSPKKWKLPRERADALLGVKLGDAELKASLERMGHDVSGLTKAGGTVDVGAWRVDLLHPVDLIEEIAIGYGFERFKGRLPERALFADQRPASLKAQRARTLLLGHGFSEIITLSLIGKRDQFEALNARAEPAVEVLNPVTQDQTILRTSLYPSLLSILRANKRHALPQAIFEVGTVVPVPPGRKVPRNELRAAAVRIASRAGFSEAKSLAEAFLRDAGIEAAIKAGKVPGLVDGRTAVLESGGERIGFFGEVHPATLERFELEAPAYVVEVTLDSDPTGA